MGVIAAKANLTFHSVDLNLFMLKYILRVEFYNSFDFDGNCICIWSLNSNCHLCLESYFCVMLQFCAAGEL